MDNSQYCITWDSGLSVGVKEIDYQHKEIINLINYCIINCNGDKNNEKRIFETLVLAGINNMTEHFSTEEEILKRTDYPKYNEHKEEHEKVLKELKKTIDEVKDNIKELNLLKILLFLRDWIIKHLLEHDKEAKEYFLTGINKK
jgi:hemerythrin-like metal-binding protein